MCPKHPNSHADASYLNERSCYKCVKACSMCRRTLHCLAYNMIVALNAWLLPVTSQGDARDGEGRGGGGGGNGGDL